MPVTFPYDDTGQATTNYIQNETHVVSNTTDPIYRIIIPQYAPFYTNNLKVEHIDATGTRTLLQENSDYILVFQYLAATRSLGIPVYGGISIARDDLVGNFEISYQTIGGSWVANPNDVLHNLADNAYNPRTVPWDQITNVQDLFPPLQHPQPVNDTTNYQDLISAISQLGTTIANKQYNVDPLIAHETRTDNPHNVTKEQVGLGNVENLPFATDDEVLTLAETEKYVTLRQVVQLLLRKYTITPPATRLERSKTYQFTVSATYIPDGYTMYWEIVNISTSTSDIIPQSGTVVLENGVGAIDITVNGISADDDRLFKLLLRINDPSGTIVDQTDALTVLNNKVVIQPDTPPVTTDPNLNGQDYLDYIVSGCKLSIADGYGIHSIRLGGSIKYMTEDAISDTPVEPSTATESDRGYFYYNVHKTCTTLVNGYGLIRPSLVIDDLFATGQSNVVNNPPPNPTNTQEFTDYLNLNTYPCISMVVGYGVSNIEQKDSDILANNQ